MEGTYNSSRRKVEAEGETDPWGGWLGWGLSHENQDEGGLLRELTTQGSPLTYTQYILPLSHTHTHSHSPTLSHVKSGWAHSNCYLSATHLLTFLSIITHYVSVNHVRVIRVPSVSVSGTIPDSCCITTVFLFHQWPMGMCVKCDLGLSFTLSYAWVCLLLRNDTGGQYVWRLPRPAASLCVSVSCCLFLAPKSSWWHWPDPELYIPGCSPAILLASFITVIPIQQTLCHLKLSPGLRGWCLKNAWSSTLEEDTNIGSGHQPCLHGNRAFATSNCNSQKGLS